MTRMGTCEVCVAVCCDEQARQLDEAGLQASVVHAMPVLVPSLCEAGPALYGHLREPAVLLKSKRRQYEQDDVQERNDWFETNLRPEQLQRMRSADGFFCLQHPLAKSTGGGGGSTTSAVLPEASREAPGGPGGSEFWLRILTNDDFYNALSVTVSEAMLHWTVRDLPLARYLWDHKQISTMLHLGLGLASEKLGVRLMRRNMLQVGAMLSKAVTGGALGVVCDGLIRLPNQEGVKLVVEQQVGIARHALGKGLLPALQLEVCSSSPYKGRCERMLVAELLDALDTLAVVEQVVLVLSLPTKTNVYLPLVWHPNVLRVVARCDGCKWSGACKMLEHSHGVVAGVSRALTEELTPSVSSKDFARKLGLACRYLHEASRSQEERVVQFAKLESQDGFALAPFSDWEPGHEVDEDEEALCKRLLASPDFNGSRLLLVVLPPQLLAGLQLAGLPVAQYLWQHKKVLVAMDLDCKFAAERPSGARQVPRQATPLHGDFVAALKQAVQLNVRVVRCPRAVVEHADELSISAVVGQQLEACRAIRAAGLIPVCCIEVDQGALERVNCEILLVESLVKGLDALRSGDEVLLELSELLEPTFYAPLIQHPRATRVLVSFAAAVPPEHSACARPSGPGRTNLLDDVASESNGALLLQRCPRLAPCLNGCGFVERLSKADWSDDDFAHAVGSFCRKVHHAMRPCWPPNEEMEAEVVEEEVADDGGSF